jgi:hypothetical protein
MTSRFPSQGQFLMGRRAGTVREPAGETPTLQRASSRPFALIRTTPCVLAFMRAGFAIVRWYEYCFLQGQFLALFQPMLG